MGYSISAEQHDKLERNRRDGRLCWVATGRGGCFNRATIRLTLESWLTGQHRAAGEPPTIGTAVVCSRHARDNREGTNFRVTGAERF